MPEMSTGRLMHLPHGAANEPRRMNDYPAKSCAQSMGWGLEKSSSPISTAPNLYSLEQFISMGGP